MIDIMIEIALYIAMGILLGSFFGWLITKLLLTEQYQKVLDGISQELREYQEDNRRLKAKNKEFYSKKSAKDYLFDSSSETADVFQKRLDGKDELIASLTTKLSQVEEKQMALEKKYEEEIDVFMFERIDLTKKYKALLEKFNRLKESREASIVETSWFSRLFSSSSVS